MTFISYAQNYEDVILYRALKGVVNGFYIDVGAQDPNTDSVTKAFYERGWRGINIEPVDDWFNKLLSDRPEDHNLKVAAAAETATLKFYEVVGTGMSTVDPVYAKKHAMAGFEVLEKEVPARRLGEICDQLGVTEIHFLKVDVEGAEGAVLAGVDLTRIRPWIILIESTEPNSTVPTHDQWQEQLTDCDYVFVHFDGLNRFYVPREREEQLKEALQTPPNYFDQFIRYSEWWAEQEVQRMEREAAETRNRLHVMEGKLSQSLGRLKARETELCQFRDRLQARETELTTVYRSRSWRITMPLREANYLLKQSIRMIRTGTFALFRFPKGVVRRVVLSALTYIQAHPEQKARVIRLLTHFPNLKIRLKTFIRIQQSIAGPLGSVHFPTGDTPGESSLTPHAHRIYMHLKAAIDKAKEEN